MIFGAAGWRKDRIRRWMWKQPLPSKILAATPGTYFRDPLAIAASGSLHVDLWMFEMLDFFLGLLRPHALYLLGHGA